MKLLLDECLPQALRRHLPDHDVFTVAYMRWAGITNGQLLSLAAASGFDALITADRNLEYQQHVTGLPISVFVLVAGGTRIPDLLPLLPALLNVLPTAQSKAVTRVHRGP